MTLLLRTSRVSPVDPAPVAIRVAASRTGHLWLAACCLAAALVASCGGGTSPTTPSTDGPYRVSGTVSSSTGGAVNGATLTITDGTYGSVSTRSDASGAYMIAIDKPAGFFVRATAAGYAEATKSVNLTYQVRTQTLDFVLSPK
jgi:hypothetical protein